MRDKSVWYGKAEISPTHPVMAGSYTTWTTTYTVGRYCMDNGGRIRFLFRWCSDAGVPQNTDPSADNYVTAFTSNPAASVLISFLPKGGWRPWFKCIEFEIKDDSLSEGDQIYITLGDTSKGSKGYLAQSFVESDFHWLIEVECFETGTWIGLEHNTVIPIIAAEPYRLVGLSPSIGMVGQLCYLIAKCEDIHGNPVDSYQGKMTISVERVEHDTVYECPHDQCQGPRSHCFTAADRGTCRLEEYRFTQPGLYRFKIEGEGLPHNHTVSNVIVIRAEPSLLQLFWGDMHAQYSNALGAGSVEEAFCFARDCGGLDFIGHQPNDFQFHNEGWEEAKQALRKFHVPGRFIPFLGYEWSGNTPAGGDRNVHFLGEDGPLHRSSHWHIPTKCDEPMDRYPLDELYKTFKERKDVLIIPHVGGRRCDISRYYNSELEPVLEICSAHGRFEWLLREALENGYTVGVIGASDDHTGRPGASYPTLKSFGTRGGLAGIYAEDLTRQGIFAALRARHTYATTGERIGLYVGTADGKLMGDEWDDTVIPIIQVNVTGTKPIEQVEILRNQEVVYSHPIFRKDDFDLGLIRIEWGGARIKSRGRETDWNGSISVEGGIIGETRVFAFDHPKQGIVEQDENHVSWVSTTSGDHDGLILNIKGSPQTIINFESDQGKSRATLAEIWNGPLRKECGGVGQYYMMRLQPKVSGPYAIELSWKDNEPLPGRNAYWVRIVQEDGEMAWSSPLYFNNTQPRTRGVEGVAQQIIRGVEI
ncbi:MAG TPA: hypothetical protein DCZ10_14850 [Pelotomaculum sp.]|nr:hypothetical protein [Pelotomaculum sp.]